MIKRSLLLLTVVLLYSSSLLAQQWTYSGTIPSAPDTINNNSGVQFVVVDANDRVWVNAFSSTGDSLFVPDSNKYKLVRPVYVYNPDGTLWKKIVSSTVGGTLYPFYGSGYGLEKDHNGNILVVKGGTMHRLDYQTGDGMTTPIMPFAGNSVGSPAVDEAGNIYVVQVLPGAPLKKYDADFTFVSNIADTILDYGRYCEVSADGFTVYVPRYSANKVTRFRTTSEFDPYTADTILHGAAVESGEWDPVDPTKIWFSVGHAGYNPPTGTFEGRLGTYLMFDTATWAFTDSIKWQANVDYVNERPRGLAFSLDGTKAYLAEFGTSLPHPVQVHVNPQHVVSVEKEEGIVVENYSLGQNYPNPFNPTTSINFTVVNSGLVTVKVYDLLGKEVATLVNEELSNGSYNVNFDASKLASGTYVYRMTANGTELSKKMMLVK